LEDVIPPTLPHELQQLDVEQMQSLGNKYHDILIAGGYPGRRAILREFESFKMETINQEDRFDKAWAPYYEKYENLWILASGLSSIFGSSAVVESSFSMLNRLKRAGRASLQGLALNSCAVSLNFDRIKNKYDSMK